MTDLFERIQKLVPTMDGWCTVEKAVTLASAVIALRPMISVEIGVFGGRSLLPIAMAHKEIGRGIVWGIEPWERGAAVAVQTTDADRKWWGELDYNLLYSKFIGHVEATGTQHFINIVRKRSRDVADIPAVIDLLHVDGGHNEESIGDVDRFASKVRRGGLCVVDDVTWTGGHVGLAVEKLKAYGFIHLYAVDSSLVLQRCL